MKDHTVIIEEYLRLLRPWQWVKNLFVFLPLIFGGQATSCRGLIAALVAFVSFSLAASAVYALNDITDRERDRLHPGKCRRPVASGTISTNAAGAVCGLLSALSLLVARQLPSSATACIIISVYLVLNILYSYWLKNIGIIDVMTIACGFVLRVLLGGVACGIYVSPWLITMVFMLTLLVAFGKRRDDLMKGGDTGHGRRSVAGYTVAYVDQVMPLLAGAVIVAYIIYTLTPEVTRRLDSEYVYVTAIFVVAAILRYLQIVTVREDSGRPTRIFYRDPFMVGCCVAWAVTFMLIIYH